MIVTGASLLGQILTNRTSSGHASAQAAPAAAGPAPATRSEPISTLTSVTMSLSTLDALFALKVSSPGAGSTTGTRALGDGSAPTAAPPSGFDAGPQRRDKTLAGGRTVVDPDLVRQIAAALESRKSMGAAQGVQA